MHSALSSPLRTKRSFLSIVLVFSVLITAFTLTRIVLAAPNDANFIFTKSVSDATPEYEEDFTYTLFYSCSSNTSHCNDVVITDPLPADIEYVTAVVGGDPATISHDPGTNTVTFDFTDDIAAGTTGQVQIIARVPMWSSAVPGQPITNTATIDASNATNPLNSNPEEITLTPGTDPANYQKYLVGNILSPDVPVVYRLIVSPDSNPVTSLVITDSLPAGSTFVSCVPSRAYGVCTHDAVSNMVTATVTSPVIEYLAYDITVIFPSGTFTAGQTIQNTAYFNYLDGSTPVSVTGSATNVIQTPTPVIDVDKWGYLGSNLWGSNDVPIGQEVGYPYGIESQGTLTATNVVITDTFPTTFDFTRIQTSQWDPANLPIGLRHYYELSNSGVWVQFPSTAYDSGAPDLNVPEEITLAELGLSNSDNVTALKFEIDSLPVGGGNTFDRGVIYGTLNNTAIGLASVKNCLYGQADDATGDRQCADIDVIVPDVATLDSSKWVKGTGAISNPVNAAICEQTADGYTRYPCVAETVPGGTADYRLVVENSGTVSMTNFVVYDILPYIGDTGVIVTSTRDTDWRPVLVGAVAAPAGVTVQYSQSANPCRSEVDPSGPAGCTNDWTTSLPSDPTLVQALRFDFGSIILDPADAFELTWPMRAPVNAPTNGEIAWNSFAYFTRRADDGVALLPAEPIKVGIAVLPTDPAAYGDKVWIDTNRDGIQDGSEIGLDGVRVELYLDNGDGINDPTNDTLVDFTLTSNGGEYLFPQLDAGNYYAVFYPPPTYAISPVDSNGNADDAVDSDGVPSTFNGFEVAITPITSLDANEIDLTWDLGLHQPDPSLAAVGNYVWFDEDGDGTQDEPSANGLNGITVTLYDSSNAVISTTVTSNDINGDPGFYLFDDLTPGDYYLEFTLPPSSTFATQGPTGSSDSADSDPDTTTGRTETFSLASGQYDDSWDAGIILPTGGLSLGDRVWYDNDNDGLYEPAASELGINGVTVNLYLDTDGNGLFTPGVDQFFKTSTTYTKLGVPGYYEFTDLPEGDFIVQIADSNFSSGKVLHDWASSDGAGAASDPDNNVDHDDNGDPLNGYGVVSQAVSLRTNDEPTDDGDSDNNSNMSVDFGFRRGTVQIGNYVWLEDDGDGNSATGTTTPVVGLVVTATASNGTVYTATTDASGLYTLTVPSNATYTVTVGTPAGYLPSGTLINSSGSPFDTDGLSHDGAGTVVTVSTVDNLTIDFGFTAPNAALGNYIWLDEDSDGYQDAGEHGLANVIVTLTPPAGIDLGNGVGIAITTTTDANGGYLFSKLPSANGYVVTVDGLQTALSGFSYTVENDAAVDTNDDDLGNQDPTGYTVDLSANEVNLSADFGYNHNTNSEVNTGTGNGAIGDTIWVDSDGDGIEDPNEIGISGITVTLYHDPDGDGIYDTVYGTTTTDSNGHYLFDNLPPSAYSVGVTGSNNASHDVLGSGYTQTGDPDHFGTAGNNGGNYGDPVVIGPGDVFLNMDFGYQPTSAVLNSVGDTLWYDADGDGNGMSQAPVDGGASVTQGAGGAADSAEYGLSGVTVALINDLNGNGQFDAGEPIIASDITDNNGQYLFEDLADGNYVVWVNDSNGVLNGLTQSYDASGGLDNMSAVNLDSTGISGSAIDNRDQDFGYRDNVSGGMIGDTIWFDLDGDGVQDPSESGIEGVSVQLTFPDGHTQTVVTDENGQYLFGGLPVSGAGELYTITIITTTLPAGMQQTYDNDDGTGPFATPHQSSVILTTASPINFDQDFGYNGQNKIGNLVWEDSDADGVYEPLGADGILGTDDDEPLIAGVTIDLYLDTNGDGLLGPEDTLVAMTTTVAISNATSGDAGNYLFEGLPDGDYLVHVSDDNGVLNGYWHSLGTPNTTGHSQNDAFYLIDDLGVGVSGSAENLTADFGYYVDPAAVGNYVWLDTDGNGLQDDGESGLNGVEVQLVIAYPNGVSITVTTVTTDDINGDPGYYSFGNLLLDEDYNDAGGASEPTFTISVDTAQTALASYLPTTVDAAGGTNDLNDSDNHTGVSANPTQGLTDTRALNPVTGEPLIASYDFGFVSSALYAVGNYVFLDENSNGNLDTVENGIDGVLLELWDGPPNAIGSTRLMTTTTTSGAYLFDRVVAGDYYVYIPPSNFAIAGPLYNTTESAPYNVSATGTITDDAMIGTGTATTGVTSTLITLGDGGEAIGETLHGLTPTVGDGNADQTVDFAFASLAPTAVQLKNVTAERSPSLTLGLFATAFLFTSAGYHYDRRQKDPFTTGRK